MAESSGDRLISSITLSKRRAIRSLWKRNSPSILWFGHCLLGIWSRTFIRLEENSCKSATGHPLSSTKNTDWEVISAPLEVKVPRDHLNHCPASWSKTLTGTTLNVDLDLELQLQNTLQAFGELWGKPSVQPWDKTWRVRTFLSWAYL